MKRFRISFIVLLVTIISASKLCSQQNQPKDSIGISYNETVSLELEKEYEKYKKSPKGALMRSAVLPGWGITYAYNRKGLLAFSNIFGSVVGITAFVGNAINYEGEGAKGRYIPGLSLACGIFMYLYELHYSYHAAKKYNVFLREKLKERYGISLNYDPITKTRRLTLSLSF